MSQPDLWKGADVRWVGGEITRDGVLLRPGRRAVVVDAGRDHMGSLARASRGRRRRPRSGVLIELDGGEIVNVRRGEIELVAPDHPLRPEPDAAAADWILEQLDGGEEFPRSIAGFVPRSLPAVCRVLHTWFTTEGEPARWHEVAEAAGGDTLRELADRIVQGRHGRGEPFGVPGFRPPPEEGRVGPLTARALVRLLGPATTAPTDVLVAVWIGWGDISPGRFPGAARIEIPQREHFLLRGPLEGVLTSVSVSGGDDPVSGLWWPADRAWLVSTEIDFPWTFVAGSEELVEDLLDDPELDTLRANHDEPGNRLPG